MNQISHIPFQELVNEAAQGGQREATAVTSWWPSGIGSCPTGRYLMRKGIVKKEPFDARTLRVFMAGNHFEDWLSDAFTKSATKRYGENITIERQVAFRDDTIGTSGKADMLVTLGDLKKLYEFKSMHSQSFHWMRKRGENGKLHHRCQLWLGLHVLNINEGSLVYISKDDLTVLEFPVYRADGNLGAIALDDLNLMNTAWKAELPPPPLPPDAWQSQYCNFHKDCVAQQEYLPVPADIKFYENWYEVKKVATKSGGRGRKKTT